MRLRNYFNVLMATFERLMSIDLPENDDEGVIQHLKTTTERMLTRVRSIYMYILENGTVTTKNVVEEFDITDRTAQRDLNVLVYNDLIASPVRGKWTTTKRKTS